MSERDALFNEIMDVIKKQNAPIGLVKAVLDEVNGEISRTVGDMSISEISDRLKRRRPRE